MPLAQSSTQKTRIAGGDRTANRAGRRGTGRARQISPGNQLGGLGEFVGRGAILLDDFNPSGKRIQTTESGRHEQTRRDTRGEEGINFLSH